MESPSGLVINTHFPHKSQQATILKQGDYPLVC